jgi:predicted permease
MRITRIVRKRIRSLFLRTRQQAELQREAALHFEQLVREHREAGLSERDAGLAARREFGSEALILEDARTAWGWNWLEDAAKDVAFGARLLRKSPGFTITAVVSLALGIGANTAIFSLLKQVILDSLPVRDAQTLVNVNRRNLERPSLSSFSYPFLKDLQSANGISFQGFLASTGLPQMTMLIDDRAEPVAASAVSGNYFELLGVHPALGRLFTEDDDRIVGGSPVTVLSYNFWNRRFGRDPSILNKIIRLDDRAFTMVGVSAAGFGGLTPGQAPDIQIPITMAPHPAVQILGRGEWWLSVFGRLKPGASPAAAGDALLPLLIRNYDIAGRVPRSDYERRMRDSERMEVLPAMHGNGAPRAWERALWVLMAMVASVLLLACVNIAHLLLARGSAREREHSVRAAIGASRGRLIRQHLTESLLLASLGGAFGIAVAYALTETLVRMMVTDRAHSTLKIVPDARILAFNFAIAMAAGVLFGLAPAVRAARSSLLSGLKGTFASGIGRMATRKILISVQIAISVMLLMGAGLFARTLASYRHLDLGFRPDRLLEFGLDPVGSPPSAVFPFYAQVRERIAALPGVESTAVGRQRLMGGGHWGSGISVEGYTLHEGEAEPNRDAVSSGYFSAVGMPLLSGRDFAAADNATAPKVAIINESFARHYFGNQNPIGERIGQGGKPPEDTIVGVVRDARYASMREEPLPFWWVPYEQMGSDRFNVVRALTLYVRTAGDPDEMIASLRQAVASVDPRIALFTVRTLDVQLDDNLKIERLLATLSGFFAGLAALLAAIGLFGVLAYSVARREREIGIRVALGASPFEASWTVIREVALYVLAGLAAGVSAALSAGKIVESFLFGVQAKDVTSMALACGGMAVIALLAALIPARRAAAVAPAIAFRAE